MAVVHVIGAGLAGLNTALCLAESGARVQLYEATGHAGGNPPNATMAWGAFYHNGLVWVNDMFSGLWVVRVEPRQELRRPEPVVP